MYLILPLQYKRGKMITAIESKMIPNPRSKIISKSEFSFGLEISGISEDKA